MTFEFTEDQNKIFLQFVMRILLLAFSSFLAGTMLITLSLSNSFELETFGFGIGLFVLGATFIAPLKHIQNIILTSGSDIDELITGMEKMNKFFFATIAVFWLLAIMAFIRFIIVLIENF